MEFVLPLLFTALVAVAFFILFVGLFKKPEATIKARRSARSFLHAQKAEKQAFNALYAALFCVAAVLVLKGIQLLICYISTGWDPFLQKYWEQTTDIPHYIDIARDGYVTLGDNSKWIVFFPLYPYILKVVALLTKEYYHTGCVLSMLFFAVALYFIFKDAYERFDRKTAIRSVLFCCLCPSSFFAMLPMSEGLFIMLCAVFLYALHKNSFLIAAVFGFLAALTRSAGVMLAFPLVAGLFLKYRFTLKFFVKAAAYSLIVAAGTLIYLLINYALFGNPFYFSYVQQSYWHQSLGFFGKTMYTLVSYALSAQLPQNIVLWLPQIVAGFFTIAITLLTVKRDPVDGAFSLSQFVYSFSATWLLSAPRYMFPIIPVYNELALLSKKSRAAYIALIAVYAIASVYLLIGFLRTGSVY